MTTCICHYSITQSSSLVLKSPVPVNSYFPINGAYIVNVCELFLGPRKKGCSLFSGPTAQYILIKSSLLICLDILYPYFFVHLICLGLRQWIKSLTANIFMFTSHGISWNFCFTKITLLFNTVIWCTSIMFKFTVKCTL